MTFWLLTNSDFPTNQTFHQFHDLDTDFDLHRITSGFHGAFATGVACQQGTLTLPDTWFRPPILGLANAPIVETKFLELAMSLLDFSPRKPLGTFSILLGPFGFLHTGTGSDDIKGNFGIRDQIRALWWVKNNIYRFGGSPNRVRKVDKKLYVFTHIVMWCKFICLRTNAVNIYF